MNGKGRQGRAVLPEDFFARPAPDVAPDLLGKYLVREAGGQARAYLITETEAYEGADDLASHASKGRTSRTSVMFGPPGRYYVYLIYGLHHMLNVVTNGEHTPSAVLIRGLQGIPGPGRLTRALGIDLDLNARPAAKGTGLWFEDRQTCVKKEDILRTPRIGVDYAGPVWKAKPWRFVLDAAPARKYDK